MPLFMFCLSKNSTAAEYGRALEQLEAQFPQHEFERVWDWEPAINNALIPVMSEPHPTAPDRLVMKEIPARYIAAVKEAFKVVVDDLKSWRPS
ncbi:unnamed protein product [Phaeothamnion confervicola]